MLHKYYERPELWDPRIYVTGYERERMAAAVSFVPEDVTSLLDVGCGNGAFLSFLEAARPGVTACGVEPSRAAVARTWCASTIVIGEMSSLPFANQSFDAVSSMAVLEHVPASQLAAGLEELSRIARRYIVVNLPYRERRTRIRCPECGCGFDPHLHLRSYSDSDISALFPTFRIIKKQVLSGSEMLIPHVVLRVLRREISAARFPNTVCPQCGHSAIAANAALHASTAIPLWRRLWESQPRLSVEREIFVVFKRA